MNNINEEHYVLYLSFVGFNDKLSNIKTYIKLNYLSKGLNLISLEKTIKFRNSNILEWHAVVNLNDNVNNYEKLESIYDILIEDGLKNNYVPIIRLITKNHIFYLEKFPKELYKEENTKKIFLKKSSSNYKNLRRSN